MDAMKHTILIIDDDDLIRNLVQQFLEKSGYNVITAPSGTTGVALFEQEPPALIVLDVAMPGMSGFEVAQHIRALEQRNNRPRTPIILLTAYARSFFKSASEDADIDSYLTKPVPLDKLLAHIQKFLDSETG